MVLQYGTTLFQKNTKMTDTFFGFETEFACKHYGCSIKK